VSTLPVGSPDRLSVSRSLSAFAHILTGSLKGAAIDAADSVMARATILRRSDQSPMRFQRSRQLRGSQPSGLSARSLSRTVHRALITTLLMNGCRFELSIGMVELAQRNAGRA
jgi:hypothetical protein